MEQYHIEDFIDATRYKGDIVKLHSHEQYEIVYYCYGKGTITIDKKEYNYFPGTVHFIKANEPHQDFAKEESKVLCLVSKLNIDNNISSTVIYKNEQNSKILDSLEDRLEKLSHLFNKEKRNYADESRLIWNVSLLFLRLLEGYQKKTEYYKNAIDYSCKYIEDRYNQKINYISLANNIGYSYDRFRHLFKTILETSPKQYQLGVRLSKAKELLKDSNDNIGNIAKQLGFQSYIRFEEWFKEELWVSPSEYRNMVTNQVGRINVKDKETL